MGGLSGGASYGAIAGRELAFVVEQLQRGAHNGSAWNYLRGLLTLPGGGDAWLHDERIPQLCCQVGICPFANMWLPQTVTSCRPALGGGTLSDCTWVHAVHTPSAATLVPLCSCQIQSACRSTHACVIAVHADPGRGAIMRWRSGAAG